MKYQETGRLGRITNNLRKLGFERKISSILFDSINFSKLSKIQQAAYIETVTERMNNVIGLSNTKKILFECGSQCCGKSWSQFAKNIWESSNSIEDFFIKINKAEKKYYTSFEYNKDKKQIILTRSKCICGLINKGHLFKKDKSFCNCSLGHMDKFFKTIFKIKKIELKKSIFSGKKTCRWLISLLD